MGSQSRMTSPHARCFLLHLDGERFALAANQVGAFYFQAGVDNAQLSIRKTNTHDC